MKKFSSKARIENREDEFYYSLSKSKENHVMCCKFVYGHLEDMGHLFDDYAELPEKIRMTAFLLDKEDRIPEDSLCYVARRKRLNTSEFYWHKGRRIPKNLENVGSMYDSMDRKFHQLVPKKDYEWHEVYVKLEVIE